MLWVCVAICAITFIACVLTIGKQDSQRQPLQHFDGIGAVLVLIFFSLVLCIPSFGQNFGWTSKAFLGVMIAAVIVLVGLIAAERKAKYPILPGRFMLRSAFILSVLALFLTQGLFRDLAAPFGVAVFVPLFTNQITGLMAGGATGAAAAVRSIHSLAIAELVCIAAGITAVFFLSKIRNRGEMT